MKPHPLPRYTVGEEIFNSVSHGVGALLAVAGTGVLITLAACRGDALCVVACCVYSLSLIILYTMSTLYHAFPFEKVKKLFRIFDHASIFILIAGSYTPFCLLALRGNPKGLMVAAVVWACAVIGIVMNAVSLEKTKSIALILYVVMGWAIVFVMGDVTRALWGNGFWLLVAGGLCYTGGLIFYAAKKRFMHSVWHLFVLGGSVLHYLCIVIYVIP
jgi:hemolysin III